MKTGYLLNLSKKVGGINSSLFASTKFDFFTYERYYKYGHQFAICSNIEFLDNYYTNGVETNYHDLALLEKLYGNTATVQCAASIKSSKFNNIKYQKNLEIAKQYNLDNRYFFLRNMGTHYELIGFSTRNEKHHDYYSDNLNVMKRYASFFKKEAYSYIIEAVKLGGKEYVNDSCLTAREEEVFAFYYYDNMSAKKIAQHLNISYRTVEKQRWS